MRQPTDSVLVTQNSATPYLSAATLSAGALHKYRALQQEANRGCGSVSSFQQPLVMLAATSSQMQQPGSCYFQRKHPAMAGLVQQQSYNPLYWHQKPDFVNLISQKYSDEVLEAQLDNCQNSAGSSDSKASAGGEISNSSGEMEDWEHSEAALLESKARGRHQSLAATLRISKIEKILSKRTDLTRQQRRKLQSRKNTANFRERQKNTNKLKVFINFELDIIINTVSARLVLKPGARSTWGTRGTTITVTSGPIFALIKLVQCAYILNACLLAILILQLKSQGVLIYPQRAMCAPAKLIKAASDLRVTLLKPLKHAK